MREHDVLELVEESIALEGVAVPLQDRVGRQEGAVEGVVVLQRIRSDQRWHEATIGKRTSFSTVGQMVHTKGCRVRQALLLHNNVDAASLTLCVTLDRAFSLSLPHLARGLHKANEILDEVWPPRREVDLADDRQGLRELAETNRPDETAQREPPGHDTSHIAWVQKTRETE